MARRLIKFAGLTGAAVLAIGALTKDTEPMRSLVSKVAALALLMTTTATVKADPMQKGSAYDYDFTSIDGKPMPLSQYKGKPMLVVNTASFCGFTRQYSGLQALYEKYEKSGLVVLGVPSNDFGNQEPGADGKIKEFCEGNFGITFPMTSKNVVLGASAHPFYKWIAEVLGPKATPAWNFHKYLIGRDGKIVQSFYSGTEPGSKELATAIEAELAKPAT